MGNGRKCSTLVEPNGVGYESLHLQPKDLKIFSNELAVKIVKQLAERPLCAMDVARKLEEHEQKIYYHIRKLEKAGIVTVASTEQRLSMTAKLYKLVAPTVHTKLNPTDFTVPKDKPKINKKILDFYHPFIEKGKLHALVVIGDSYSHGKYDASSKEAPHAFDLGIFLGHLMDTVSFPHYKLDTHVTEKDMKKNLILIGNNQTNTIIEKINKSLPVHFDISHNFAIVNKRTKASYTDPRHGFVIKQANPFNPDKKILVLGGRTRGTHAAILAVTSKLEKIVGQLSAQQEVFAIVKGLDVEGNNIIDDIKVREINYDTL